MATEDTAVTTWMLEMREECGGRETIEIEADSLAEARTQADEETTEWIEGGEYGDQGASVSGWWTLRDEDGDEVETGSVTVEIEADRDALIPRTDCGDTEADHDWTAEGGCTENPGVWSIGGTRLSFATHCRKCGLKRREMHCGSQRNPGDHDTVEYIEVEEWDAQEA